MGMSRSGYTSVTYEIREVVCRRRALFINMLCMCMCSLDSFIASERERESWNQQRSHFFSLSRPRETNLLLEKIFSHLGNETIFSPLLARFLIKYSCQGDSFLLKHPHVMFCLGTCGGRYNGLCMRTC